MESWRDKKWFGRADREGAVEKVSWKELTFRDKSDLVKALVLMGYLLPTSLLGAKHVGTELFDYLRMPECSGTDHSAHGGGACKTRDAEGRRIVIRTKFPNDPLVSEWHQALPPEDLHLVITEEQQEELDATLREIGFPEIGDPQETAKLHDPVSWEPTVHKGSPPPAPRKPDPRLDQKGLDEKVKEILQEPQSPADTSPAKE